jgi:Rv2632c-like
MNEQKTWRAEVSIAEEGDVTRATAVLNTDDGRTFQGEGLARRNPQDAPAPRIGDELATARALSELTHKLLEAVAKDIEETQGARPQHLVG